MMLSPYISEKVLNRSREITEFLSKGRLSVGRSISDRRAWEKVKRNVNAKELVEAVERSIDSPFLQMTEEIYFEQRTQTDKFQADKILFSSMRRLEQAVLAECIENKGRFLDFIKQGIEAYCELRSWVRPGHDAAFDYCHYKGTQGLVDLYSSSVAWRMSVIDCCVGEKLGSLSGKLEKKVREQVIDVYNERLKKDPEEIKIGNMTPLYWLDSFDNWLAVCLSGVTMAGLYYGTEEEKALYVALYEKIIRHYLRSLEDGYCVEGMSYWGYGFSKFLTAADLIAQATNRKIDLVSEPAFLEAALLGFRMSITEGTYPSIGDSVFCGTPLDFNMKYISRRAGTNYPETKEDYRCDIYEVMLMSLWNDNMTATLNIPECFAAARDFFPAPGVLICRNHDKNFGICIKGGTNHDPHNHNDLGSYTVAAGKEILIADPGFTPYRVTTFTEKRYAEQPALGSFGHSVPTVCGKQQGPELFICGNYDDIKYKAKVLKTNFSDKKDEIVYDLTGAYEEKKLNSLVRTMVFDRILEEIRITDSFIYQEVGEFETAVIAIGEIEFLLDGFVIRGMDEKLRVTINTENVAYAVSAVKDVVTGDHDVTIYPLRLAIGMKKKVKQGEISYTIRKM